MAFTGTSRRAFLGASVLGWGGGLIGACLPVEAVMRRVANARRTSALESVLAFGRRYLSQFPAEAERGYIADQIRVAMASSAGSFSIAALDAACAADLAASRIVVLDGWVMPRTEGQACALVALSQRGPE